MSKTWKLETYGAEGEVVFYGVKIFDYKWEMTGEKADVRDPNYKQKFSFNVYTVDIDGTKSDLSLVSLARMFGVSL